MPMPRGGYVCKKGCRSVRAGRPVKRFHPGAWDCPKESTYDKAHSDKYRQDTGRTATSPETARAPPNIGAPPETPQPQVPPAAQPQFPTPSPTPGKVQPLILAGTEIAETSRRTDSGTATTGLGPDDWVLDEESTVTTIQSIRSIIVQGVNIGDDLLGVEKSHYFKFEFNGFDENNLRTMFARRLVTTFYKKLGCKTLKEAQEASAGIAFVGMFGLLFLSAGSHAVKEWGPQLRHKIAEWKAKNKEKARELERQRRLRAGEPLGELALPGEDANAGGGPG